MEAFGIFDSAEELGLEPDDEGLPPEAYQRGRWNCGHGVNTECAFCEAGVIPPVWFWVIRTKKR